MEYFWVVWVVIGLLAILIECLTLGFAVLCFAVGAFVAALAAYVGVDVAWQLALFSLFSIISLVAVRPMAIKYFGHSISGNIVATNIDALVGRRAVVTQEIRRGEGRVSIDGDDWRAEMKEIGEVVAIGDKVEIESVDSVILIVKKI
ncbi:MAG: NfeD family protein [Rikenellaceae bacterium]